MTGVPGSRIRHRRPPAVHTKAAPDNVDLQHEFLLLDHTKNGEQREISINATLRATLQELFKGTSDRPQRIDVPNVFYRIVYNDPTEKTKPTGKAFVNVQKSFIVTCRRAKLKHFRSHDLRHTFASQLVMAGIDITTVKELLEIGRASCRETV